MLAGVWALGRVTLAGAALWGVTPAAVADAALLPLLLTVAAREIVAGRKWRDLKLMAGVGAIAIGNLGFHAAVLGAADPAPWLRGAVAGYVLLILIICGRIIPSFTRNWDAQLGAAALPVPFGRFEIRVIAFSAVTLVIWVAAPESGLLRAAALVAAALKTARLARWRGGVPAGPLVFVLHPAYGFVPLGFLALAAAQAVVIGTASALHVLTVVAVAAMMLAVMTRATRGHTGRALTASGMTVLSYQCLFGAAIARPLADLTGGPWLLGAAGSLWIAPFGLFVAEHAAMLICQRRKPRAEG
ncbi:hypothetical protein MASR2M74_12660 [Paracoccaceae bacterium]